MLFVIVLLHEFGHCFAARKVDGEADEILMWPLGGLAYCSRPAHAAGQLHHRRRRAAVNVVICLVAGGRCPRPATCRRSTSSSPASSITRSCTTGRPAGDGQAVRGLAVLRRRRTAGKLSTMTYCPGQDGTYLVPDPAKPGEMRSRSTTADYEVYPAWVLWTARLFWMSWLLLLFNLIPAFPLDGGRLLQAISGAGPGTTGRPRRSPAGAGWSRRLVFLLLSFWLNDALMLFGSALFMMFTSYQQLMMLDHGEEEGAFGYDFSKGYGGFGPDEDAPAAEAEAGRADQAVAPGPAGAEAAKGSRAAGAPTRPGWTSCSTRSAAPARSR